MSKVQSLWAACALSGAILLGVGTYSATTRTAGAEEGRHPRIHHALEALREAEKELTEAPHDFGGHRAEAVEAIHRATQHLEACEKY